MSTAPCIALLSNPRSTGNLAILPQVRSFVAAHPSIFHYEVESVDDVPEALRTIARMKPVVLAINGGDGTVQAALTEMHLGGHFDGKIPPVAVLPNGKTNLIALDLGAHGDALGALRQLLQIAETGMDPHVVRRQLIALTTGQDNDRPVLGMFLGGAGLAEIILFCRHRIYPLGLPNSISHFLAALALVFGTLLGIRARWLPAKQPRMRLTRGDGRQEGNFLLVMVTTLERIALNIRPGAVGGALRMMAIEQNPITLVRLVYEVLIGRLGRRPIGGLHLQGGDTIRIEGGQPSVVMDGELFQAANGGSITLTTTPPVSFVRLAA
ncbi:diacylglycerol/lipid kinase family protein [Glacieibacterium frigidum]|uniref:Diacylglycerol kinase n=1 Tax=Glacieibacterium frigidum TaxID=2593303 RepID=A0A552U9T9_9SPHN|nr:diacylglycerol kinase family protein [Glacieibacterium frigidum]TRW14972.1 diacylglycerol kinase [Glacieibacterium frigidum]